MVKIVWTDCADEDMAQIGAYWNGVSAYSEHIQIDRINTQYSNFLAVFLVICQVGVTFAPYKAYGKIKKNRTNSRTQRNITKEYRDIMKKYSPLPVAPFASEWQKQGDFFVQFSLFDETQRSFATNSTTVLNF